jgi:hypothetical protein
VGAFGWAVIIICIVTGIAAILSYIGSGRVYQTIGKGQFALDTTDRPRGPAPGSRAAIAEQEDEVRQLLQAKSDRREARGEAPLDVEAELQRLTAPAVDPGLEAEVRQLVIARNERRERRGQPPLDVEEEVARQLRELGSA